MGRASGSGAGSPVCGEGDGEGPPDACPLSSPDRPFRRPRRRRPCPNRRPRARYRCRPRRPADAEVSPFAPSPPASPSPRVSARTVPRMASTTTPAMIARVRRGTTSVREARAWPGRPAGPATEAEAAVVPVAREGAGDFALRTDFSAPRSRSRVPSVVPDRPAVAALPVACPAGATAPAADPLPAAAPAAAGFPVPLPASPLSRLSPLLPPLVSPVTGSAMTCVRSAGGSPAPRER